MHIEKYSPKSYVVNFHKQKRKMALTREKKKKKEKNYTSNQKRKRCEFRAKIPAFYRRLQLAAPLRRHSTRKVFSKCFSHKKCEKHLGNWSFVCFAVDEENCREPAKQQRKVGIRTRCKLKL